MGRAAFSTAGTWLKPSKLYSLLNLGSLLDTLTKKNCIILYMFYAHVLHHIFVFAFSAVIFKRAKPGIASSSTSRSAFIICINPLSISLVHVKPQKLHFPVHYQVFSDSSISKSQHSKTFPHQHNLRALTTEKVCPLDTPNHPSDYNPNPSFFLFHHHHQYYYYYHFAHIFYRINYKPITN